MSLKGLIVLVIAIVLFLMPCGLADSSDWTCLNCKQEGNTGNFCDNCGTARPSAEWTCTNCGQSGNTGKYCFNCGAQKPEADSVPAESIQKAATVNKNLEQIPGESERVKVIVSSVSASSFISNKQDPKRWKPENAVDGNETTCWQFSARKGLKGKSWIDLTFGLPQTVDEIWFKNGFWAVNDKGKDQYIINARPKQVRISFYYEGNPVPGLMDATLKDESRNGWQRFSVGHQENVSQVRISVYSIYKGSAFPNDVCLSEVMPVQIAWSESARPASNEQIAVIYESRPDITGCNLLMKLATRSGPGTEYAEPGTFFANNWQNQTVKVMKKSFDGSIWWVQVDFQNGSKSKYRVWTGVKRVDVDLNKVAEEKRICDCDIIPTSDTWYGPGGKYAKSGIVINRPAVGTIYQIENGYVDVQYWYEDDGYNGSHRIWLPQDVVYNLYYGDYSGE